MRINVYLEPEEFIGGLFSLLYVISSTLMGLLVLSRYFRYKQSEFIFIGLSIAGIACPWWPSSVSFLWILLFQRPISTPAYFIIGNAFAPVFTYCWIIAMNKLLFDGKNKVFLYGYAIVFTAFDVILFLLLFIDLDLIGTLDPKHLDVEYHFIIMALLILIVVTVLVTGLMVSMTSIKSTTPLLNLKGKVLLISFLIWAVAATLDAAIELPIVLIVIVRTLLITHSIGFYIGWIMPEFAKNFFIKIGVLKME